MPDAPEFERCVDGERAELVFHLVAHIAALSNTTTYSDSLTRRLPTTSDRLVLITPPVQAASSLNRTVMDSVVAALVRRPVPEAMLAAELAISTTLVKSDTAMARGIIEPLTRPEVPPALRSAAWVSVGWLEAALGNWNRPWQADRSPGLVNGLH